MNLKDVFVKEGELSKWAENDVKTYAQIRIIGNLDSVVVNTNYRNDDYLRMKKQEIENKGKQDLIEFIRPFNQWIIKEICIKLSNILSLLKIYLFNS